MKSPDSWAPVWEILRVYPAQGPRSLCFNRQATISVPDHYPENVRIQNLFTTYSVPGSEPMDMKETKLVLKLNTETKNHNVTLIPLPTSCFGKIKSTLKEESWEKCCLSCVLQEHQLIKTTRRQGGRGFRGREMGARCIATQVKRTQSTRYQHILWGCKTDFAGAPG